MWNVKGRKILTFQYYQLQHFLLRFTTLCFQLKLHYNSCAEKSLENSFNQKIWITLLTNQSLTINLRRESWWNTVVFRPRKPPEKYVEWRQAINQWRKRGGLTPRKDCLGWPSTWVRGPADLRRIGHQTQNRKFHFSSVFLGELTWTIMSGHSFSTARALERALGGDLSTGRTGPRLLHCRFLIVYFPLSYPLHCRRY